MGYGIMIKGLLGFYKNWYPYKFKRDLIAIPLNPDVRVFKRTCRSAESVYKYVVDLGRARSNVGLLRAGRDIVLSVVDQITKKPDRIFLDFDMKDKKFDKLAKELQTAIITKNNEILDEIHGKLRDCVFSSKKIRKCFESTITVRDYFKAFHDVETPVFFSGAKGFHLYIPLYPKKHEYYNEALTFLAKTINEVFGAPVDLAVCRDALVRKARIPYTPNMKTGLYCVPVLGDEDLSVVLERSESPGEAVQNFGLPRPSNSLEKLVELCEDYVIEEEKTRLKRRNLVLKKEIIVVSDGDLREAFRAILGEPAYSSEDYDQYHCPFPTHDDFNPSFTVWGSYWKCFGCLREGANLERFKKEYERSKKKM